MTERNKKGELFLEIGTEEIPSSYLAGALARFISFFPLNLANQTFSGLDEIQSELTLKAYQTPRRLVFHVEGLRHFYEGVEKLTGPSKEICYQGNGTPTKALEGFLKRHHASAKEVAEEGGRVVIQRTRRIRTEKALASALPETIHQLSFPKLMRWNGGEVRFPRPIRWILCVYDGKIILFKLGHLKSGGKTCGVGPEKTQKIIKDWKSYSAFLKKEKILLEGYPGGEAGGRKRFILEKLKEQLQKLGGSSESLNETLLDEVTNLVEKPVLFSGHFDEKFLKLPKEVLIASLSKYQRLFSVENRKGQLLSSFVACANGSPSLAKVKKNYEHVLNARLEDAGFFFEEDTREPFSKKKERLRLLIYHQKLGTMYDKSERLKKLAVHFSKTLGLEEEDLLRACELSKNDLVTEMVKEFPSLQGIVGASYARISGEKEKVALAIREQYLPKGDVPQDSLTFLGSALSFLEKLDHLVGCFHAGESPTGSSDPYGLRRAANALFWILLDQQWDFSLRETVRFNFDLLGSDKVSSKLCDFLQERLKSQFREKGFRTDLVEGVVLDIDRPVQMSEKLSALKEMMEKRPDDFLAAFKVVERTHNILKPIQLQERQGIGEVAPDLFQDEIEKSLWTIYNSKKDSIEKLIGEDAWEEATVQYGSSFSEKLHQFFEKVLVNTEDPKVRQNRLAMMKKINELYTRPVADLSKLMMNIEKTS